MSKTGKIKMFGAPRLEFEVQGAQDWARGQLAKHGARTADAPHLVVVDHALQEVLFLRQELKAAYERKTRGMRRGGIDVRN